ncbi:MAG: flagellar export protein FliJ [Firmicutes bacterium]|nr:flagellar export protein FliJ [Bacillota bacterium]
MKPFKFRLKALLEYRKLQEEQFQLELACALAEYNHSLEEMQRMVNTRDTAMDLLRQNQKHGLTIEEFKLFQNYLDKLNGDIQKQSHTVEKTRSVYHERQELLLEAAKKSKIVEKFKEKRFIQYYAEQLQEEQKMIDEVGTQVFIRQKAGNS